MAAQQAGNGNGAHSPVGSAPRCRVRLPITAAGSAEAWGRAPGSRRRRLRVWLGLGLRSAPLRAMRGEPALMHSSPRLCPTCCTPDPRCPGNVTGAWDCWDPSVIHALGLQPTTARLCRWGPAQLLWGWPKSLPCCGLGTAASCQGRGHLPLPALTKPALPAEGGARGSALAPPGRNPLLLPSLVYSWPVDPQLSQRQRRPGAPAVPSPGYS